MKIEDAYIFRSSVSLEEMLATFNRLGPWRWVEEREGEQIAASLPDPARGTIKIMATREGYAADMTVEANTGDTLESIYDTLLYYLLPAVDSSDIAKQPRDGGSSTGIHEDGAVMRRVEAYKFKTKLSLAELLATFNATGPWRWIERDNDRYGAYISSRVLQDPDYGMMKLFVEPDHYAVDAVLEADTKEKLDAVHDTLFERLLPSVNATDIADAEHYE